MEKELLIVRFLDWITEESFDWMFQKKIYDTYLGQTDTFLDVEKAHPSEKERITKLKSEYERLNVKESAYAIQESTDEVTRSAGVKMSPQSKKKWVNRGVFGSLILLMALFYIIPLLTQITLPSWVLFIVIIPVCFLPNLLNRRIDKKINEFKYIYREELMDAVYEDVNNIKTFIQLLIDDAQDYMVQERFPLHKLQFQLKSNDYLNLELIDEKIIQESILYNFTFEYPPGVEPFETPSMMRSGGVGVPTAVSDMDLGEDDENDLFIIIKNPKYDDSGHLNTKKLEYVELGYKPPAETLLEKSEFTKVVDPASVIKNFENFSKISCSCGESIKIGEIQKVSPRSYEDFYFYLMIGENCEKCNSNPFILVPLPNMNVPEDLADIFIDPLPMEGETSGETVDYFTVLRNVRYDEQKKMKLEDYEPFILEDVKKVQNILGKGSFKKLKEPTNRFSDYNTYQIPCGCEDNSLIADVQLVTLKQHDGFKFYLLIGEKCNRCNVEPFMLIPAPEEQIPEDLKSVF